MHRNALAVCNQQPRRHGLSQEKTTLSEGGNDGEVFGSRRKESVHGNHLARMKAK
jgi:hypothetical protein